MAANGSLISDSLASIEHDQQLHRATTQINTHTTSTANANNTTATTPNPTTATTNTSQNSINNSPSASSTNPDATLSKTNLYIRGLHSNTKDHDLYVMCQDYGLISSTKAILDKTTGTCRGYGFVEFTEPKSAELAVQELTKSGIQAQMAKISPTYMNRQNRHQSHHSNQHHHNSGSSSNSHHHHHHHHHPHHNQHQQNNSSSNSNSANDNNTANNLTNNGNPGIGSLMNASSHSGYNSNNNSHNNSSSTISTTNTTNNNSNSGHQHNHSNSNNVSSNHADPTNLYIANLPPHMSETELENLLSSYGPVVSSRILRDQSNIPRGVGFARMESRDKCEQVIQQLNGRPCKGWKEPLLVKFADGGNKKRHHNNNNNNNNNHHNHKNNQNSQHKVHQEDTRWRDSSNTSDLGSVSSFDHPSNISHSNHLSDLAVIGTLSYPRIQPVFPPNVAASASYPAQLVPPTSAAPQWIHPGGAGPAYVIPQQMIQAGALGPTNQAALHYGHIPQLTSQMQGLQIAHPGAPVGGYLPPQHQWSPMWTHPIPQQAPSSMPQPLPLKQMPPPHQQHSPPQQSHQHQQPSSTKSNPMLSQGQQQQHQVPQTTRQQQHQGPITEPALQVSMPL